MKNMDDYRFQNELEYQLALLESIRKLLLVYEKFYQEETKGDMLPRIGGSIPVSSGTDPDASKISFGILGP